MFAHLALALLAPLSAAPTPTSGSLTSALASIDADAICEDVAFLASDELEGRDSPSEGLRQAARYIRARLEELGWQAGARDGFFHTYELDGTRLDMERTSCVLRRDGREVPLEFGADWFISSSGVATLELSGDVVFCGNGSRDAFEAGELVDRWALVVDDGFDRQEMFSVLSRARRAGAAGLVLTPGPAYAGVEFGRRFRGVVEGARTGLLSRSRSWGRLMPFLYLSKAGAAKLGELLDRDGLAGLPVGEPLGIELANARQAEETVVELENVCGFWPGNDPDLADETIVISAHYDHVGLGSSGLIHNGADDNGSGSSTLLALASGLVEMGPQRRSVLLLWVSAEEKGLLGSRAWTLDPWLPNDARAICNINIDMVGRNAPDKLLITPSRDHEEHNGLVRLAEKLADEEGFPDLGDPKKGQCDTFWDRSDQKNFAENLGLPVAFFFSDVHEDYHQPTDDPDKIDCDKIRRTARLVLRMLDSLQADEIDL